MKSINLKTDKGMLEWQNMLQMHQDEKEITNIESIEGCNQTHTNQPTRLDGKPNSNRDTHSFFNVHKNKQTNNPTQLDHDNQIHKNNGNLGIVSESNGEWETGRSCERPRSPDISKWAQKEHDTNLNKESTKTLSDLIKEKDEKTSRDISQWAQKQQQAQAQRLQLAQKQKQAKAQKQFENLQTAQQERNTNSNQESIKTLSIFIKEEDEKTTQDKNIQNTLNGTKQPTQQDHDINSYKEQIKILNILVKEKDNKIACLETIAEEKDEKISQDKNIQNTLKETKQPTKQDHDINSYKEHIKMLNILVKEKDDKIAGLETVAEIHSGSVCNKNGTMIYRLVSKKEYENVQQNRRKTNCQNKSTQTNNNAQLWEKDIQILKDLERPKDSNRSLDLSTENAQKLPKQPTQQDHDINLLKDEIKMLKIKLQAKRDAYLCSSNYNKIYREDINTLNIVMKKKKEQFAKKDAEVNYINQVLKEMMEQFNSCKYNEENLQAKVLQLEQELKELNEAIWKERGALENKAIVNKLVMENYDKENANLKKENANLKKEKEYFILDHKRQETENQELKNKLRVTKENYDEACKFTRKVLEEKEKQDCEKKADIVQKAPARPNFAQRVSETPKETYGAACNNVSKVISLSSSRI